MAKIHTSLSLAASLFFLVGLSQTSYAKSLVKVVSCPCPSHKNTEILSVCKKDVKMLKPFDFHLNVKEATLKEDILQVELRRSPEVVSDRPGVHEFLESAQCIEHNIKELGDNVVIYVLWNPATQKVVIFKGVITQTHPKTLKIQVNPGTDIKGIQEILAHHKDHPTNDLEIAILAYAVMTKESPNAQSERTSLQDRVNYFLMSEGPVKVEATRDKKDKYPYDITLKGVKDIIRIDVTGNRQDIDPETFVKNWSLGPNSFALSPPDGNFTLTLSNGEEVFNAMQFNGPPSYTPETHTMTLQGKYLEDANNQPQVPPQMQTQGVIESAPDRRVGVFLDRKSLII